MGGAFLVQIQEKDEGVIGGNEFLALINAFGGAAVLGLRDVLLCKVEFDPYSD
jgi:hypothetical protein